MQDSRVDPFDAARERRMAGKRRRRGIARPDAPRTIVPLDPPADDEPLSPDRLDAARAQLRRRIPPKPPLD
jgi:hypothetical protein